MSLRAAAAVVGMALVSAGCGPRPDTTPIDQKPDGGTIDDTPATCGTAPVLDTTFDLDAIGRVQIHPSVAFDGRLWVVFNRGDADATGGFDVFATRLECDGTPETQPFRVNTAIGTNDGRPVIARGRSSLLVTWLTDESAASPNNLSIRHRVLERSGNPKFAAEKVLETTVDGLPATPNAWMPAVSALTDGSFAIAGTRALPGATGFQAFVQRVDQDGALVGATLDADPSTSGHSEPAIAVSADGVRLVWARDLEGASRIESVLFARESFTRGDVTEVAAGREGEYPAASGRADGRAYAAFQSTNDQDTTIVVRELGAAASLDVGAVGRYSFAAEVAAVADGGAVAWLQREPGTALELHAQRFRHEGARLVAGRGVTIPTVEKLAIQPIAIAHVQDDIFAVGWSEGTHPNIRVKLRLIDFQ